jgi:hypothetical protein
MRHCLEGSHMRLCRPMVVFILIVMIETKNERKVTRQMMGGGETKIAENKRTFSNSKPGF